MEKYKKIQEENQFLRKENERLKNLLNITVKIEKNDEKECYKWDIYGNDGWWWKPDESSL